MKSRFWHDLKLRVVKTIDLVLETGIFAFGWYVFYSKNLADPFYSRETWLIVLLFLVLFILFGRTYDSFLISVSRVSEIVFSQGLALFFADLILYFVTILLQKGAVNPIPILMIFGIQLAAAIFWANLSNQWYYWHFPKKKSAIVYDVRPGLELVIRQYGLEQKFDVTVTISALNCTRHLGILDTVDVVFLSGVHSHDRNVILKHCILNDIEVYVIPRIGDTLMDSASHMHLFHLPILRIRRYNPVPEYVLGKRLFDLAGSALLLLLLSPVILVTAIAIRLDDGGKVFYRQTRLTKDGKKFKIFKFRSMREDAEQDGVARLSSGDSDDRVTRVGRFIRKTRIDEIPQLFNILAGQMSVVGPRPERPEIAELYEKEMPEFRLRLQGKAGLTGYAQVYGKYNTDPYDKLQMDLMYFAHPSFREDLRIIFATIKILFLPDSTEGIQEGQTTAMDNHCTEKDNKDAQQP